MAKKQKQRIIYFLDLILGSTDLMRKGYTQEVLALMMGKNPKKNYIPSYNELDILYYYFGDSLKEKDFFLRKFEFLKIIDKPSFDSPEVVEAMKFLEKDHRFRWFFWEQIPVEVAIEKTDSIYFLNLLSAKYHQRKSAILNKIKDILSNNEHFQEEQRGSFGVGEEIKAYFILASGNEKHLDSAKAFLNRWLGVNPICFTDFLEIVIFDDVMIKNLLSGLKGTEGKFSFELYYTESLSNRFEILLQKFFLKKQVVIFTCDYVDFLCKYKDKPYYKTKMISLFYHINNILKERTGHSRKIWLPFFEKCIELGAGVLKISEEKDFANFPEITDKNIDNLKKLCLKLLEGKIPEKGFWDKLTGFWFGYDDFIESCVCLVVDNILKEKPSRETLFYRLGRFASFFNDYEKVIELTIHLFDQIGKEDLVNTHVLNFMLIIKEHNKVRFEELKAKILNNPMLKEVFLEIKPIHMVNLINLFDR